MKQKMKFRTDISAKGRLRQKNKTNHWAFPLGEVVCIILGLLTWQAMGTLNDATMQIAVALAVVCAGTVLNSTLCRRYLEPEALNAREEWICLDTESISYSGAALHQDRMWWQDQWEIPYNRVISLEQDRERSLLLITWRGPGQQEMKQLVYLYYRDQERMLRELSARCGVEIRQTPLSEG